MSEDLDKKYRPKSFEHIEGQKDVVRFLSGLILQGQAGKNMVLHGAIGSGKTSLARVYAKALNCKRPTSSGSACWICERCALPNEPFHEYDVSGRGGSEKGISDWLRPLLDEPKSSKHRIIFFDEAHSLETAASDTLLKLVEDGPAWLVFLFATTEPGRMRKALLSRLHQLEIWPLSPPLAIRFLQRIAQKEGILIDGDALRLLAALKQGQPRDLLIGLDQVRKLSGDRISLDHVRSVFTTNYFDVLKQYFIALGNGDLAQQIDVFSRWRAPPSERVSWIQAFAVTVFYKDIYGLSIATDTLTASIPDVERRPILECFCSRLNVTSARALEHAWRGMIDFLNRKPTQSDETALILWLTLFHDFINLQMPALVRPQVTVPVPDCTKPAIATDKAQPHAGADGLTHTSKDGSTSNKSGGSNNDFVCLTDVRDIINAASFIVQEHGLYFNTKIEINTRLFGIEDQAGCIRLIHEFERDLEERVEQWSDGGVFARLTLTELYEGDYRALIVARLPTMSQDGFGIDVQAEADAWCQQWLAPQRIAPAKEAIRFTVARRTRDEKAFHWRAALELCAALDEDASDCDSAGRRRPLWQLLNIPRQRLRWAFVGPLRLPSGGRPFSASALLQRAAIEKASALKMEPLSAFDDKAWEWLARGWEMQEYSDRCKVREDRRTQIEMQRQLKEPSADLSNSWPDDPHDRPRSWLGWWGRGDSDQC